MPSAPHTHGVSPRPHHRWALPPPQLPVPRLRETHRDADGARQGQGHLGPWSNLVRKLGRQLLSVCLTTDSVAGIFRLPVKPDTFCFKGAGRAWPRLEVTSTPPLPPGTGSVSVGSGLGWGPQARA